jgi:hypothetical protein
VCDAQFLRGLKEENMSAKYEKMWQELGLNLGGAHDALLGVLKKGYQDIYLAQKNRPEGMGYFDFVMSEIHGLRIVVRRCPCYTRHLS